jgi:hypothetical protein
MREGKMGPKGSRFLRHLGWQESKTMDFCTQRVIENMGRKAAEEMERKNRLDPYVQADQPEKADTSDDWNHRRSRLPYLVHGALVFAVSHRCGIRLPM